LAGEAPPKDEYDYTIQDACEDFYESRRRLYESGQLAARTLADYDVLHRQLIQHFGRTRRVSSITREDWRRLRELKQKRWGPKTLQNFIARTKAVFSWCYQAGKIFEPMQFGLGFKKPPKAAIRKARYAKPPREFTAEELRQLLAVSSGQLHAMILRAINGGLGQTDLALLKLHNLDLKRGWIDYPRPKTGIQRQFPLWPETVAALEQVVTQRKESADYPELVFLTRSGAPWVRQNLAGSRSDAITLEFTKLKKKVGISGYSKGFYAIRHTFRTVADECYDQPAIMHVMGHGDDSMSGTYRERISAERLVAVTDYVRKWLFYGPWKT